MSKYAYNNTVSDKTWKGQTVLPDAYYQLPDTITAEAWSNDDNVIADISSGDLIISSSNSSTGHVNGAAEALNFLNDNNTKKVINSPFADKERLFFRGQGVSTTVAANTMEAITFTIPYAKVKLNGIEILYGNKGDTCNFKVLDSDTGTYSTIPNYTLNQFGYNWNVEEGAQKELLPYDADVFYEMQLVVEYTNNTGTDALIGVNFYIHEDKS